MAAARYLGLVSAVAIVLLCSCATADNVDLPVATGGTEAWSSVVAKAMSFGGKNQAQSLEALQSFQEKVMSSFQQQAESFQKLAHGDLTDFLVKLVSPNIAISAPMFFANGALPQNALISSIAGVSFGFTGVGYAPCAVPVTPIGVGIFPQGVNIQPEGFNIAPTGVNVQPQGASISPTLIVIGPYDTTVAGQGLNIAPALISVAPVTNVVNPVGPLSIADTLISVTAPALPGK